MGTAPFQLTGIAAPEDYAANRNAANQVLVDQENARRVADYNTKYANWALNMASGQQISDSGRQAPVPQNAMGLGPADASGVTWFVETSTPVCAQKADVVYQGISKAEQDAAKPAGVFEIGHVTGNKGWFSVGFNDTMPEGHEESLMGPDGVVIKVLKTCTPWGCSYKQVG